nr:hypothetical protein [Bacillus stercoris]
MITVPFNDIESYKEALDKWGSEIAAVLVEPIVATSVSLSQKKVS